MFDQVEKAPPDPILGLTEAFRSDSNPQKVNLSVGVYKDAGGMTPVLESVKEAERRILDAQKSKSYVSPLSGEASYTTAVRSMIFGPGNSIDREKRAVTAHTPGGTGALRLAGDYLRQNHEGATIWMTDPTWANHPAVFDAAGVSTRRYGYFDSATGSLDFDHMMSDLDAVPAGDVVLLHGCCHNPTGVDPDPQQWTQIGQLLAARKAVPLVDLAYQGFAEGLEQDVAGVRNLCAQVPQLMISSSFSKNFALYCDRVGALTIVADAAGTAGNVLSQLKVCIRRSYSNPPAHGSSIVTTILDDAQLRKRWEGELAEMRDRINAMRRLLAQGLDERGVRLAESGNAFIERQKGMFSMTGLQKQHVEALRSEHSVYVVASGGRINVAGLTEANIGGVCNAFATVLGAKKTVAGLKTED